MIERAIQRRNSIVWCLYDFANSIVSITFFLYFSQWLVFEKGLSDVWFNSIFVISSILLILTAPVVAQITDIQRVRLPGLRISTHLAGFFYVLTALSAIFISSPWYAFLTYIIALYFYLLSFCFYNALLVDLAEEDNRGKLSGLGQLSNWIGQIVGVLIAIPFLTGAIDLPFSEHGRSATFLPATILFYLLSLPMMYLFVEGAQPVVFKYSIKSEYRKVWGAFCDLCSTQGVGWFFLAFLLINDATMTFANNFPIYLQAVFDTDDKIKSILTIAVLITCAIGSFISGRLSDRFSARRVMVWILIGWTGLFPILSLLDSFYPFAVLLVMAGLLHGSVWTVSRALLFELVPSHRLNLGSSYYTLTERFATFIGPIGWSTVLSLSESYGADRYRIALGSLTIFILLGLYTVNRITINKKP